MAAKEKYVLCFGNPYVKGDGAAQNVAKKLKIEGLTFVSCSSAEEIVFYLDKDFIILDVAKGIRKITEIKNLKLLETGKIVSLHDFDLAFFLKIMNKLQAGKKKKNRISIMAVPERSKIGDVKRYLEKKYLA